MKLDVAVNEVILSNTGASGEFKIRNSAKAFKILSDGLYSNKIRAIIRELSCNAIDSHVAAGTIDKQFVVHLPNMLEPYFSVKDYGTGLDGEQVMNIYTTYFESTKTNSNDFIGALGLGSKSPFSYTENFTVTATKNGVTRIYSAYINELGVPCVTEMSSEETTEPNGVEVKFSVTDRYDYHNFATEAFRVFKWFKHKPLITGNVIEINPPAYKEQDILPGIHRLDDRGESFALMGNICYPIRLPNNVTQELGQSLVQMLSCSLVFEFGIGELDFTASREELSYIPVTINSIKSKLLALRDYLVTHVEKKAAEFPNNWKKAEYFYRESQDYLLGASVKEYVAKINFPYFDTSRHNGQYNLKFHTSDLSAKNVSLTGFTTNSSSTSTLRAQSRTIFANGGYNKEEFWEVMISSNVRVVINDLKTGCTARARAYYRGNAGLVVICINTAEKDPVKKEEILSEFLKEFGDCPNVIRASTLPANNKPKNSRALSGLVSLVRRSKNYNDYEWVWLPSDIDEIDETKTYYYVNLSGYTPLSQDRETIITDLSSTMEKIRQIDNGKHKFELFGVRKMSADEIEEYDNFVWFEEKLKEIADSLTKDTITSAIAENMIDSSVCSFYNDKVDARSLEPTSCMKKFLTKYKTTLSRVGKSYSSSWQKQQVVTAIADISKKYGKAFDATALSEEIQRDLLEISTSYPLIDYIHSASKEEVTKYIKLIDKQEK